MFAKAYLKYPKMYCCHKIDGNKFSMSLNFFDVISNIFRSFFDVFSMFCLSILCLFYIFAFLCFVVLFLS